MSSAIEINLPLLAPSINDLWVPVRGRLVLSSTYKRWINDVGYIANTQIRGRQVTGPYKLTVTAVRPKRAPDLDNVAFKAVSDLLVRLGAIEDDSHCEALFGRWVTAGEGMTVRVERAGLG
jgi:Holliday junction resolvase RusA-like endonuclease